MRYLFLFLLIIFLCTSGHAQLEITADLGLVTNYCTGANPDPNADCLPVPTGNDDVTYLPGQDGDLMFTYRIINNSGKIIQRALATDSRFGAFFPSQVVNIPNGATVPLKIIYDALTTTETINGVVTLTVQYANGTSEQVTGTYTLEVVAPMVSIEFGVARKADICDHLPLPESCIMPYGALNGQTVTVGAKDTFTTRIAWTNTGLGEYEHTNVVDQDGFQYVNWMSNQAPGLTRVSARHWEAPDAPGTYNYSQLLTATDLGGNIVTAIVRYIVIVEAPTVSIEFGVARKADICDHLPLPESCIMPYGALNGQTVRVGAKDTFTTRFAWTNTGLGEYEHTDVVDQDGFQYVNWISNQEPGLTRVSARHWEAPSTPGTYNYSQLLTATDLGGNIVTATVNYIVIVEAPTVSIEFGVVRKADICDHLPLPESCIMPYGALNSQTITVGTKDTFTTRIAWTNTGLGEYEHTNVVDQDGFQYVNWMSNQAPGLTRVSAQHWEAPDAPGTYNYSQLLTATDLGGNIVAATVTFIVIVDCSIVDLTPPVALCRDRTFSIIEGGSVTLTPEQINNGSYDGCGSLAGWGVDVTSLSCEDEGPNTVTLLIGDEAQNLASCTATVRVVVEAAISSGEAEECLLSLTPVNSGQAWWDINDPDGKLMAQVIIGSNTNIKWVRAAVYTSTNMIEGPGGNLHLSKRYSIQMLDANQQVVLPNNDPVYVRLYYTADEVNALLAAVPAVGLGDLAIIKTDGGDCGTGYTGQNAAAMNTTLETTGCGEEDSYFEFFTGTFSSFYLFPSDAPLPVDIAAFEAHADDKQRVMLNWTTASESGSSHFEVEHSTDGRNFTYVGAVAGAGDTFQEQRYDFLHESPAEGTNYYRLRQIDLDGTETLSEVREVTISAHNQLSVFPNPTTDELSIKGFAGGPVRVLDLQGRTVLSRELPEFGTLRVKEFPAGIYLLRAGEQAIRWVKQ